MDFYLKMRVMRALRGLSQTQVARGSEINYLYINSIEQGKRPTTQDQRFKIRQCLDWPDGLDAILEQLGNHGGFVK